MKNLTEIIDAAKNGTLTKEVIKKLEIYDMLDVIADLQEAPEKFTKDETIARMNAIKLFIDEAVIKHKEEFECTH